MPSYFPDSSQIDHWGYFNGKKFDLNNVAGTGGTNISANTSTYKWNNYFFSREPLENITQAKAGTLNTIKLPTGGFQRYEVEQNDYNYLVGPLKNGGSNINGIGAYRYYLTRGFVANRLTKNSSYYVDSVGFSNTGNNPSVTAGLRIKEFKAIDMDSSTVLSSKKYIYREGYSNGTTATLSSSGILDGRIDYFYYQSNANGGTGPYILKREAGQAEITGNGNGLYFSASAWAGRPPVTYNAVTEISSDNSYITHDFLNYFNRGGGQHLDYIRNPPRTEIEIGLFNRNSDLSNERGNIYKTSIFSVTNSLSALTKYYYVAKKDSILSASLAFNMAGYSVESRFSLNKTIFNLISAAFSGGLKFAQLGKLSAMGSNAGVSLAQNGLYAAGLSQNIGNILNLASNGIGLFSEPNIARYYNVQGSIYYDQIGSYQLQKVESTTYDINTPTTSLLTTKFLRYNRFLQLAADSTVLPNNTWIANRYKYVSDITYPSIPSGPDVIAVYHMFLRNMLSYPIEIQTIKNGKTIGANLNFYKRNLDASGNIKTIKLDRTLSLKHDDLSALPSITYIGEYNFAYQESRYITTTSNLTYDASGNLTSANDRSGLTSKIEYNSFHLPVKKYIDEDKPKTETNYEYELLRGVTKVTDANAQKIHYQYDDFNRLKKVKDNDNATILKVYQYGTQTSINPSTSTFLAEAECKINSSICDLAAYAASDSSTITCDSTTSKIVLNGWDSTDSTDVHYTWTGPNGYSSKDLNPEPIKVTGDPIDYAGKYLLTVTRDGCTEPDTMSTDINIQCNGCTKANSNFKISGKVYPSVVSTCGIVNLSSFCDGCSTSSGPPLNLITNGDFTNGNIGFSSDFSFNNGWNLQYRSYKLDDKTNTWEWFTACGSRPAETSGNMMIGYGGGTQRFWYQNITTIQPNTDYTDYKFTYWAVNLGQNIDLKVTVNSVQVGTSTILSTANADCAWKQITVTWNSGSATSAVFAIVNNKDSGSANGFALDNITLTAVPKDVKWTGPNGFVSFDKNPTKVKTPTVAGTY